MICVWFLKWKGTVTVYWCFKIVSWRQQIFGAFHSLDYPEMNVPFVCLACERTCGYRHLRRRHVSLETVNNAGEFGTWENHWAYMNKDYLCFRCTGWFLRFKHTERLCFSGWYEGREAERLFDSERKFFVVWINTLIATKNLSVLLRCFFVGKIKGRNY